MSGDHLERLEAFADAWRESNARDRAHSPSVDGRRYFGDSWFEISHTGVKLADADLRAAVDELKQLRAEREADDLCARTAAELLAATVAPTCETDRYGNCATHGVLVLDAGSQCPHVLARAFLSSARLWLNPAPQQPVPDGGEAPDA